MEVGIIAPISMLEKYCKTRIQYFLPRLLEESQEYKKFYQNLPEGTIKIMDCRKPTWKREPEDLDLCKKGLSFDPDYVILPSVTFDSGKTIKVAREYSRELKYSKNKLITCVEGTTKKEVLGCARELKGFSGFAIPSHLYGICKKVSSRLTIYIENHLRYEELEGLDGILVTSFPVRLGLQGRLLSNYPPSPPSINFYEEENKYSILVEKNIEEFIKYYEM